MIDPMHSLAFSVHANRGVYALLLGSGVSRAANIPTGWEITLDLIGRLAAISNESPASPEEWYREKYEREPDYRAVLADLAKTQAERQQLLLPYWEPTPEERERGDKAPTAAHRAIATLAARGYFRVIITTNFDRLIESALDDEGVRHQVLSTEDQIQNRVSLVHAPCTVLKLHGDYLDTRICNTPQELESYPEEHDRLLDSIFYDFGLIVCGWSAEWDEALRKAIYRAASRQYTTYWTVHGELGEQAEALISHRKAETVPIKDADSFFQALADQVAIEDSSEPHPLSTEIAVATIKQLLPNEQSDIRLHDFVNDLVENVIQGAAGPDFSVNVAVDAEELNARVRRYGALCEKLIAVATVGGFWCETRHHALWARALRRLHELPRLDGYRAWLDLRRYPATLLLYSLGIGAVAHQRFHLLGELLSLPSGVDVELCVAEALSPYNLGKIRFMRQLEGMAGRHYPLNDWMFRELRSNLLDDSAYERAFDEFEMLLALNGATRMASLSIGRGVDWHLPGRYLYHGRPAIVAKTDRMLAEIDKSITDEGDSSPYVANRIFGNTASECRDRLLALSQYIRHMRSTLW